MKGRISAALLAVLACSVPAWSATFTVNTTADSLDGFCTILICSLRDAVVAANANPGTDTITLPPGTYQLTRSFALTCPPLTACPWDDTTAKDGDLDITGSLVIHGAGARNTIIRQTFQDRVFDVLSGSVEIDDVTITGGDEGGYPRGSAPLISVDPGLGGGVHVAAGASLLLQRSAVIGNNTRAGGAAPLALGSAGGGIAAEGTLDLEQSLVADNVVVNAFSAALFVGYSAGAGVAMTAAGTIRNSTVADNTAIGQGTSDTTSNQVFMRSATLTLQDATVSAVAGGVDLETKVSDGNGGFVVDPGTHVNAGNSILARSGCSTFAAGQSTSNGHNLDQDGSCHFLGAADLTGDPKLDALANNGGGTDSMKLGAGSPAIDSGDPADPRTLDQTGSAVPQDGDGNGTLVADRGAFEGRTAKVFTVTKTADTADGVCDADCSLREAVIAANASPGADKIVVPAGTYTLTRAFSLTCPSGTPPENCPWNDTTSIDGDLDVTDDVTIQGASARTTIVQQTFRDRVFEILAGNVTIQSLTITGGNQGAYPVLTGSASQTTVGAGGGVRVAPAANLTLRRVAVTGNATHLGATCFLSSCNSTGPSGGGVDAEGPTLIDQSLIANNSVDNAAGTSGVASPGRGAGIAATAATTVRNSTVTGNVATVTPPVTNQTTNQLFAFGAPLTVEAATVTPTSGVDVETGIPNSLGGMTTDPNTQVTFRNAIAKGLACSASAAGQTVELGFSILGSSCGVAGPSDQIADALLGALANNGGETDSMKPGTGSPAIDSGDTTLALTVDQTGAARPQDGDNNGTKIVDRGAVEVLPVSACGAVAPATAASDLALYGVIVAGLRLSTRKRRRNRAP